MWIHVNVSKHEFDLKMTKKSFIVGGRGDQLLLRNLSLLTKKEVTAVLELRTCGSVDWSCTDYSSEIDSEFL